MINGSETKDEPHKGRRHRIGNIGTDLMLKILRLSTSLEMAMLVGIDPDSDGLRRANDLGVPTTHEGVDGLIAAPDFTK